MKRVFFFAIMVLTGVFGLHAQSEYTWNDYNVSFNASPALQIKVDNKAQLEAADDNVMMRIFPWSESLNFDDLSDATMDIAIRLGFENVNSADAMELDDYQAFYTKGIKDGQEGIVVLLYDNQKNISLVSTIIYQPGFENEAMDIALSFYMSN